MAKKLDVDIDPGKFLDSFRPEMPAPASPGSLGTDGNTSAKEARLAEKPKAKVGKDATEKEEEYLERFLHAPRIPVCSGKTAYIRKSYHSGYSVSCRSSGRTGLRCRSMWTVCWSSTSANTRK